jgi:ribosome-associated translation inhibitor RaiA
MFPLQITYRNMKASKEAENWVREYAAKLERFYERITRCRVLIEIPHAHREWGKTYQVRVDVDLPGTELVVKHEASLRASSGRATDKRQAKALRREEKTKDLHLAIRNAFVRPPVASRNTRANNAAK